MTEELRMGQCKGSYIEHCGSGTPQPANKFKMADRRMKLHETKLLLDVAHLAETAVLKISLFSFTK